MVYRVHYVEKQTGNYSEDAINEKSGCFSSTGVADLICKCDYFEIETKLWQKLIIFDEGKLVYIAPDMIITKIIMDALNKRLRKEAAK